MRAEADLEIERALERTNRRAEAAFAKGDMAQVVEAYYTEAARYITPDHKIIRGRAEIARYLRTVADAVNAKAIRLITLVTCAQGADATQAYQIGNGMIALQDGTELGTHYLCIFRKVGTDWLCETEMSNSETLP